MATFFEAKLKINAPPSALWEVLIDFDNYGEWNPFITHIDGKPKIGTKISLHLRMDQRFDSVKLSEEMIVSMKENQHLSYDSHLMSPSLFNTVRWQTIRPTKDPEVSIYHSHHRFSGLAAWPMGWVLGERISTGFEASTLAFKKRVESLYGEEKKANANASEGSIDVPQAHLDKAG